MSKIFNNRKAQGAESQFNWIFVLIVGVLILTFFGYIILKQKTASEAKFSGTVTKQLNTILVGAKVSSGTVQEIPTPEVSIRFSCTDYYIGPASQRLGTRVIFAPEYLDELSSIITWTLDWNNPFKVTSFLYLTSPKIRYYVIGPDNEKTNKFYKSLPDKLNKKQFTPEELNSNAVLFENDKAVRFIFYNTGALDTEYLLDSSFSEAIASGLSIEPTTNKLQFLSFTGTALTPVGEPVEFHEDPVMFGAIFSDNKDIFDCVLERAYTRLNIITQVYFEKLNLLAPEFKGDSCELYYLKNQKLSKIIFATQNYPPDFSELGPAISGLKSDNTRLQLQSCPLIY